MPSCPVNHQNETCPRSDIALIASNNDQEQGGAAIGKGELWISSPPTRGPYIAAKSICPNSSLTTSNAFIREGDGYDPNAQEMSILEPFQAYQNKTDVQDLSNHVMQNVASDGEAKEGFDNLRVPCSRGGTGEEAFDVLDEFLGELEDLFSFTVREEVACINDEHDVLAEPLSTYTNLENCRNDTIIKETNDVSESEVQRQDVSKETRGNCVYGLALNARFSSVGDQSACSSTDSHHTEVFDHNNTGSGRSTPQTLISEGLPIPDGEDSLDEEKRMGTGRAHDESLFNSMSCNGATLEQNTPDKHGAHIETESSTIDLRKSNALPRQHITDALYNFEKVESSLKHNSTVHSRWEAQVALLGSICNINVGFREFIYRWEPGSTLTFHTYRPSFPPNTPYAAHATNCLKEAADRWNEGEVGVKFEQVPDDKPATFRLVYINHHPIIPGSQAMAFLPIPSEVQTQQPELYVFSGAFNVERGNYNYLTNIFCHELGHILGLRHEFAKVEEWDRPCVQFGRSNSSSVMNYHRHAKEYRIQESDYNDVRRFYAYRGAEYEGCPIIDTHHDSSGDDIAEY